MYANALENIILDLRQRVMSSFDSSSQVLMNILDALTVGPRIATPFELALSPIWGYDWSSLYTGIRRAAEENSLFNLQKARISWPQTLGQGLEIERRVGRWKVRILDSTNYHRPKTETVRIGYVHGSDGMRPGHGLSVLSEKVAEGSWSLPLEIALIPVESSPTEFGAKQVVRFVENYGWKQDEILTVDAHYTNAPTLRPLLKAGVQVLGRVSSKRVFYLPPSAYSGRGRPRVRGKKIKLSDARTQPEPDSTERVCSGDGRSFEVSCWPDVRMRKWPEQPLRLYRVTEYRADGTKRYKRPL